MGDPAGTETPDLDNVNGDNNDTDPTNDPTPYEITPNPSIELIKSIASVTSAGGDGAVDDVINYTFTVTNTGDVTLTGIAVTDADVDNLSCGATSLAPGASTTCTATYTITQADVDAGGTENTATVTASSPGNTDDVTDDSDTGTDANGGPVTDPAGEETPDLDDVNGDNNDTDPTNDPTPFDIVPDPSIELIKSISSVVPGGDAGPLHDLINYTFTVTNTGNVTLSNISVDDADVTGLTCAATTLAPGASTTCSATYAITQADVDAGGTENVASVTASSPGNTDDVTDDSDTGTDATGTPVGDPAGTETPDLDNVNGDNNDGDPTNDPTPYQIATDPAIQLIKSIASVTSAGADGLVDDVINYSFTVTNTGNVNLTGIAVADADVDNLSCGATSLAPGASTTCTATYTITQADVDAGGTENTATVTASSPGNTDDVIDDSDTGTDANTDPVGDPANEETPDLDDVNGDNNDADPTNDPTPFDIAPDPSIELIKSIASVTSAGGDGAVDDVINYTFTVTNTGNVTLDGIAVADADVTALSCGATSLAPGTSTTCTATYTITQADVDAGGTENTATVTASSPGNTDDVTDDSDTGTDAQLGAVGDPAGTETPDLDNVNGDNNDTDPTNDPTPYEIPIDASLSITKTDALDLGADGVATVGDIITYSFVITNTGNVTASNITVDDADVMGLSCMATTLAPGATTTCSATYALTQADIDAGSHTNTAIVNGEDPNGDPIDPDPSDDPDDPTDVDPNGDGDPDDPTVTPIPVDASLSITKTDALDLGADGVATVGDIITYSFVITNTGNVTASNITVDDADVMGLSCMATTLAPGATTTCSATYALTQADIDAGSHTNTAIVNGEDPNGDPIDPDPSDDPDDPTDVDPNGDGDPDDPTITPLPSDASLSITKTDALDLGADGVATVGDIITYSFVITNTGNVTASNITVDDADVMGLSCMATTLAPGATTTCSATYALTQADIDAESHSNTAIVNGEDPNGDPIDPDPSDDPDDPTDVDPNGDGDPDDPTVTPIPTDASLSITKTDALDLGADGVATVGDIITYSFVITNTGNVTASNITVDDADVMGLSCMATTLAPGATTTCSATYALTQADIDAGSHSNTAIVNGEDPNGDPIDPDPSDDPDDPTDVDPNGDGDPDDPTVTPLPQTATMEITKTDALDLGADGVATVGDIITYSFVITNTGNVTIDNISVDDADVTGLSCNATSLAPGATTTCSATYALTQADIDAGSHTNTAIVNGTDPNGDPVSDPSDDPDDPTDVDPDGDGEPDDPTVTPLPQTATMEITKTDALDLGADGVATVGDIITYSFVITNTGNVTVDNISVDDADVTGLSCNATSLAPGATTTCSATYALTQADIDAGSHTNTAIVNGTDPNGDPVSDPSDDPDDPTDVDPDGDGEPDDPTVTPLPSDASLSITKTDALDLGADGVATVGDIITYSFVITNTGNVTVSNITVDDADVMGLSCMATTLAPGATTTCSATYALTQADIDAGSHTNTAIVNGEDPNGDPIDPDPSDDPDDPTDVDPNGDGDPDDPTVTPIPADASLSITKTDALDLGADGVATVGDIITYSFVITNTGNVTASNITVDDADVMGLSCMATTLAPGATTTCSATYALTQADIDAGSHTNTAIVNGEDPNGDPIDPDPSDDPDDPTDVDPNGDGDPDDPTETPIPTDASLSITKTDALDLGADGVATVGDIITYSFVITNTGNVTASNITVDDADVMGLSCMATTLAPGATTTCSATYALTQADIDAGSHTNTAIVNGEDPNGDPIDPDPSDDPDDPTDVDPNGDGDPDDPTVTPIPADASLSITKTDALDLGADGVATVGDVITYSFVITNTGNVTASNITVDDADVMGLSCMATTLAPGATTTCSATYALTQADIDAGSHTNTAIVNGEDPNGDPIDPDPSDDPDDPTDVDPNGDGDPDDPTVTPIPADASLSITKTDALDLGADGVATVGDIITYSFVITNTGNVTVNNIIVDDADVMGLSCMATTLAPGATTTCSATYALTQADIDAGSHTNTAIVNGTDPNGDPVDPDPSDDPDDPTDVDPNGDGDPDDPTVTPIPTDASLSITKTDALDLGVDGVATVGDIITYSFVITNTGNVTASNITVDDADVMGLSCMTTTLAPGATTTCSATYALTQADIDAGSHTNTAIVNGEDPNGDPIDPDPSDDPDDPTDVDPNGDGDPDDPTVTPIPMDASLSITKTDALDLGADGVASVGDIIMYSFVITNTGNVTASNISVDDPDVVVLNCMATTLAPGATTTCTANYVVTQADIDAGSHTNTAIVNGDDPNGDPIDPDPSDDPDDPTDVDPNGDGDPDDPTVTPLDQTPSIQLYKTVQMVNDINGNGATDLGDEIVYVFTITNTGNVTLDNIDLVDPDLTGITCLDASLAPGAMTSCSADPYVITQLDVDRGYAENTATVNSTDPNGDPVSDVSDDGDDSTETPSGDGTVNGDPTDDPTVTPICPVIDDVIVTNPTDCDGNNGSIIINASGANLLYSIDGGLSFSDNNQFFGLGGGTYNVVVRSGDNDCEVEYGDVVMATPPSPQIDNVVISNVSDCGSADGQITIMASGGTTGVFEYSVDGGTTWQASNIFSGLVAGSYPIMVRNLDGSCEVSGPTVQLVPPAAPEIDFVAVTNPSGCGVDNGVITVNASGGDPNLPLQYSIDGGATWTNDNVFSGLAEGSYQVRVRNGNGTCESGVITTVLSAPSQPVITDISFTDPSCTPTGSITIMADGGDDPGNYLMSVDGGVTFQSTTTGELTFNDLDAGVYTILVQNADGSCEVSDMVTLTTVCADLSLTKVVDATNAVAGDVVTFTVTIMNDGPSDATGVEVTDQLPGGYTYIVAMESQGTYDENTGVWMVGDLANEASASLEIMATVTGVDDYVNLAQITASDQDDIDSDPAVDETVDDLGDGIADDDEATASIQLCLTFNLWVNLEGSLITPQTGIYTTPMRTTLNESLLLPGQLSQDPFSGDVCTPKHPYNTAPWNYMGLEGDLYDSGCDPLNDVTAGYPATVVDWVLVSLRTDPTNGTEAVCQRAALLHDDGSIEFVADAECCDIDILQSYYIVIEHRNHLIVMSHEAIPVVDGALTYDFRVQESYIDDPFGSGSFVGQKEVLPGVFAMFAGNGDQTTSDNEDTDITASDQGKWNNNGPETRTYNFVDYNMDGDVSALDYELWQSNSPGFTSVPRD